MSIADKMTINTDKESLRIGAEVINLTDASTETFNTNDFADFVRFATGGIIGTVFYNESGAQLLRGIFEDPRKNAPLAALALTTHPRLEQLIGINGKGMDLDTAEVVLRRLKLNMTADGINLLDNLADFKVAKVQKIERKKERNGNYKFLVARESAGSEDFAPPEVVKFQVPLFAGLDATFVVKMEFRFEFKDRGDGVQLVFTFENLNLDEELLEARKKALGDALREANLPAYWGKVSRSLETNAWAFQRNPVEK